MVLVAHPAPGEEGPDQGAEPAGRQQDPDRSVPAPEHLGGEHRQQPDHATPEPEASLHRQQGGDAAVASRVAHGLHDRRPQRGVFPLARLGERPPHSEQQRRGRDEGPGVHQEGGLPAEDPGDQAAEGRPHREHRPPGRTGEHVRCGQVLRVDQVGDGGGGGRVEQGVQRRQPSDQDEHQPDLAAPVDHQEPDADTGAQDIGGDHQPPAVQAVGKHPAEGADQEERDQVRHQHARRGERGTGQL